jgi:hypothetical protein
MRFEPAVTRFEPAVTRFEPAVTRFEPAVTRFEPAVTRFEPTGRSAGYFGYSICQRGPAVPNAAPDCACL